jgi:hypothetical protein
VNAHLNFSPLNYIKLEREKAITGVEILSHNVEVRELPTTVLGSPALLQVEGTKALKLIL